MNQKTSNKFISSYLHFFLFTAILVVTPFECHYAVFELDDAVIGNGNAMRISSEIFNDTARVFKGWFAVDNPFFLIK